MLKPLCFFWMNGKNSIRKSELKPRNLFYISEYVAPLLVLLFFASRNGESAGSSLIKLLITLSHSGRKSIVMKLSVSQRDMFHREYAGMVAGFEQRLLK